MAACTWCGSLFEARATGGKAQRFCSPRCRRQYEAACRAYAEREHREGRVPTDALRMALQQRARSLGRDLGSEGSRHRPGTRAPQRAPDLGAAAR